MASRARREAEDQARQRRQEEQRREEEAARSRQRRQGHHEQRRDPPSQTMTAEQALEIMELKPGATEEEIRAAYNRLMQRVHPDLGGSNYFAKQLNAARDVLLKGQAR